MTAFIVRQHKRLMKLTMLPQQMVVAHAASSGLKLSTNKRAKFYNLLAYEAKCRNGLH